MCICMTEQAEIDVHTIQHRNLVFTKAALVEFLYIHVRVESYIMIVVLSADLGSRHIRCVIHVLYVAPRIRVETLSTLKRLLNNFPP